MAIFFTDSLWLPNTCLDFSESRFREGLPFYGGIFILVRLVSYFVFGERFSNYYFLGLGLVVLGLIVITLG